MSRIIGYLRSCFSVSSLIICSLFLSIAIFTIAFTLNTVKYEIQFDDNGLIYNSYVYSYTVEEALSEAGIAIRPEDEISCLLSDKIRDHKLIRIKRAKKVNIAYNGETKEVYTLKDTAEDLISDLNIPLGEENLALVPLTSPIVEDMTIEIIPKKYEEVIEIAQVPFDIEERPSYNMDRGSKRVVRNGENGEKEVTYKVLKHNGEIIEKEQIGEKITKKPINKVLEYGTIATVRTSRGDSFRYKRELTVTATAYCIKGRTATGMRTARGVIAVDPNVIPLGSKVFVEAPNGKWVYGYAVAADTGGSVKGNKIDLYMETKAECLNFGVRTAKVYILE